MHGSFSSVGTNNTGGVLENVGSDCLTVDGVFSDPFLVAAHLGSTSDTDAGIRIFLDILG